jgi:hypothetical protein
MPCLLTEATTMICPHGGMITGVPASPRVRAGSAVLRIFDTFTIAGCPSASPCTTVDWVVGAHRVSTDSAPMLNDTSVGLCLSASEIPQGMVLVVSTQGRVSGV